MTESISKKLKLYTPAETSERLGISTSTLAKWRLTGDGPAFVKIGARVAYDETMIETWLTSRVRRSTSDDGKAA